MPPLLESKSCIHLRFDCSWDKKLAMISNLRFANAGVGLVDGATDLLVIRISGVEPSPKGFGIFSNCNPAGIGGTGGAVLDLKILSSRMIAAIRQLPQWIASKHLQMETIFLWIRTRYTKEKIDTGVRKGKKRRIANWGRLQLANQMARMRLKSDQTNKADASCQASPKYE